MVYPETLRGGSTSPYVEWLQDMLGLETSGTFDVWTRDEVVNHQVRNGLTPDGIVGADTWKTLLPDVPYYNQGDPRWGAIPYTVTPGSRQTIKSSGCAPSAMAMIVTALASREVLPPELAKFSLAHKCRTKNSGTLHKFFYLCAEAYGLTCAEDSNIRAALEGGKLVIANMGRGYYTQFGHFITLWTYNKYAKTFGVLDPGSRLRTEFDGAARIMREAKKFYVIGGR